MTKPKKSLILPLGDLPSDVYQPTLVTGMLSGVYWIDEAVRQTMEALGMQTWTRTQGFLIINVLFGERRPSRLAKRLGVSRQAVGQLISELVQMGHLTTGPDPDDSRAVRVDVSPSSATVGRVTVAAVHAMEDYLAERLGPERLHVVREFLQMDWGLPPTLGAADLERAVAKRKPARSAPGGGTKREVPHQADTLADRRSTRG